MKLEDRDDERDKLLASDTPSDDRFKAIREAFALDYEAVRDLYEMAVDDFRFVWIPGNQWDDHLSRLRGKRPKYEYNLLRQTIKQVINDNRQNTPSIKVRATENGDADTAELRQGLIRNIESQSNADTAYDWGGMYAITSGFGCWEVATKYASDDTFDQDVCIRRIENPFSVIFDCAARELDRSDARRAWKIETMTRSEFREKYPNAELVDFEGRPHGSHYEGWFDRDNVRVAAYWYKRKKTKRIYRLSDGRVVDADGFDLIAEAAANPPMGPDGQPTSAPVTVDVDASGKKVERTVEYWQVMKEIISGKETLEGPFEWAGDYIPLIPCWGDIVSDNGTEYWCGMARTSRDAQVVFNFSQSNMVEAIASQPKAPWLYTPKMVQGFERQWEGAAVDNAAGLPYNPDPSAPGAAPRREAPPAFPQAWFELARINVDNMKSVTGLHDASLGKQGNETSGKAILARQHEGDVATFDYSDNITRAIQYTGIVVNNLIGKIYDAERELRILGDDMAEKYVRVNRPIMVDGKWVKENDLTTGKYDIVVTTGPSYATQRMETADAMMQLANDPTPLGMIAKYGFIKSLDSPGMDELLKGARKVLVGQGLLEPDEGDDPPQPPQPNPKDVTDAQKNAAMAKKYDADATKTSVETQRLVALDALQFGHLMQPPPQPLMQGPSPMQPMPPEQPPQGGFFVPGQPGMPPQ